MRSLYAEASKLWSLPMLWGVALAGVVGPGVLASLSAMAAGDADRAAPIESRGFEVMGFGQPLVILLAALLVGSEYSGAQIRTTLLATPHRMQVFAAKLVVVALSAGVVAASSASLAVLLARVSIPHGLGEAPFTVSTWTNIGGVVVNYVLMAVLSAGITALARTPLVAVIVLVPMVLGLTISLVSVVPALRFLPDLAGMQLLLGYPGVGLLEPGQGVLVMLAWAALSALAAGVVFGRRDVGG